MLRHRTVLQAVLDVARAEGLIGRGSGRKIDRLGKPEIEVVLDRLSDAVRPAASRALKRPTIGRLYLDSSAAGAGVRMTARSLGPTLLLAEQTWIDDPVGETLRQSISDGALSFFEGTPHAGLEVSLSGRTLSTVGPGIGDLSDRLAEALRFCGRLEPLAQAGALDLWPGWLARRRGMPVMLWDVGKESIPERLQTWVSANTEVAPLRWTGSALERNSAEAGASWAVEVAFRQPDNEPPHVEAVLLAQASNLEDDRRTFDLGMPWASLDRPASGPRHSMWVEGVVAKAVRARVASVVSGLSAAVALRADFATPSTVASDLLQVAGLVAPVPESSATLQAIGSVLGEEDWIGLDDVIDARLGQESLSFRSALGEVTQGAGDMLSRGASRCDVVEWAEQRLREWSGAYGRAQAATFISMSLRLVVALSACYVVGSGDPLDKAVLAALQVANGVLAYRDGLRGLSGHRGALLWRLGVLPDD